jgi:hypothetical protein
MRLLCLECGNYTYFTSEVQVYRSVKPGPEGLIIDDVLLEDFNYSECNIRDELRDNVDYLLKQGAEAMYYDYDSGQVENNLISCARCESKRITPPYSEWAPKHNPMSIEQELMEHKEEFKQFRKEKHYANTLPVLWKP